MKTGLKERASCFIDTKGSPGIIGAGTEETQLISSGRPSLIGSPDVEPQPSSEKAT